MLCVGTSFGTLQRPEPRSGSNCIPIYALRVRRAWERWVSCVASRRVLNVGSRSDNRGAFATKTILGFRPLGQSMGCSNSFQTNLCLSKEKYPKETTPGCRFDPPLLAERGCRKGFLPRRQRDASLHHSCGLIRPKAPVLGGGIRGGKPSR